MAESAAHAAMGSDATTPLRAGTMAGIVIGSILFIVIVVCSCLYIRHRHRKVSHPHSPPTSHRPRQQVGVARTSDHSRAMPAAPAGSSVGRPNDGSSMSRGEGLV
ncbi:hypothetical protein MMC07_005512 [Pseudocyphellaria aurata]|nr:hypothetical protein [Pseudocyphellaria aurata]